MYDFVYVTNVPSFYKINLFNEISLKYSLLVIFLGNSSAIRNDDFVGKDMQFESRFLSQDKYEDRNILSSCISLFRILSKIRFRRLFVGGWDHVEYWLAVLFAGKNNSILVLESTIFESKLSFFYILLKQQFCKYVYFALPSGVPHAQLLKFLNFSGNMALTGGVGLVSESLLVNNCPVKTSFNGRLLYVGRLAEEKNVKFLIDCVNIDPRLSLDIVGSGPDYDSLVKYSSDRIRFYGFVDNRDLPDYFKLCGALVLTSHRETWGLVVEEAAYCGCPCIVHNHIGCFYDLVEQEQIGLIYSKGDANSFNYVINNFFEDRVYSLLVSNCNINLYNRRKNAQVDCYEFIGNDK